MALAQSKVTAQGQISVPLEVRRRLGIGPGSILEWDEEGMFFRSDHANFARHGVPIAFFFTGLHHDYHQTTDTVDRINFPKLARGATYVYDLGFEIAQQDQRPLVDPGLWAKWRGQLRGPETPAAPMRVKPASEPSEKGGEKGGDEQEC